VSGVHAFQPEALPQAVEGKEAQSGKQRARSARTIHAGFAYAGRADEVNVRHHDPARVFLAEQDDARHQEIQIRRPEGTWPAHRSSRIATGAHQIDVAPAIDLSATQKERVDSALRRKIEQFDAAAGEKIVFRRAEQGDAHRPGGLRACQQSARTRYWR